MSNKTHSFNIEDAIEYGVDLATIMYNFRFWLDKNKADGRNIYDGRVWTYNSASKFTELFPYFSQDQIQRRLKKLEDAGVLIVGNYNEKGYDRTKWYSISEDAYCIEQDCETHSAESRNGLSESAEPIPDSKPDSKPDNIINYVEFVDFWNECNNCNLRVTSKKREMIRARLNTFSEEEIKKAIKNRSQNAWINGEGKKFKTDWKSFWRNDEKVENYLMQDESAKKSSGISYGVL